MVGLSTQQPKLLLLIVIFLINGALGSRGGGEHGYYKRRGYPELRHVYQRNPELRHRYENADRTLEFSGEQLELDRHSSGNAAKIMEKPIHPFPKEIPPSLVYKEKEQKDTPPLNQLKKLPTDQNPKTLQEIENNGGVAESSPPEVLEKIVDGHEIKTLHQKTARLHRQRRPFHHNRGPPFHHEAHERNDERRPYLHRRPYHSQHNERIIEDGKPPRRYDIDISGPDSPNRVRYPENRRPNKKDYGRFPRPREPPRIYQQQSPQKEGNEPFPIEFEPQRGGNGEEKVIFPDNKEQSDVNGNSQAEQKDLEAAPSLIAELTINNPQIFNKNNQRPKKDSLEQNQQNNHNVRPHRPNLQNQSGHRNPQQKKRNSIRNGPPRRPSHPQRNVGHDFQDDQLIHDFESEKLQSKRVPRPPTRPSKRNEFRQQVKDKNRPTSDDSPKNRHRQSKPQLPRPVNRPNRENYHVTAQKPNRLNKIPQPIQINNRRPVLPQQRPNIHQNLQNNENIFQDHKIHFNKKQHNRNKTIAPPVVLQRPQITEYRPLPPQNINRPVIRRPQYPNKVLQRRPITHYKPHKPRPVAFPKPRPLTNDEQTRPKVEYGFVPFFGYNEEEIKSTTSSENIKVFNEKTATASKTKRPIRPTRPTKKVSVRPTTAESEERVEYRRPTRKPQKSKRPTRRPHAVEKLPNLPSLHSPYSILKPSEPPKIKPSQKNNDPFRFNVNIQKTKNPTQSTSEKSPEVSESQNPSREHVVSESQQSSVRKPAQQSVGNKKQIQKRPSRPTSLTLKKPLVGQKIHQSANNQWTALMEPLFNKISFSSSLNSEPSDNENTDKKQNYKPRPYGLPQQNRGPTGIHLLNKHKKPYPRKPVRGSDNQKVTKSTISTQKPTIKKKEKTELTSRPTRKPAEETRPSFTGFLSGMFDWHGEKTTENPPTTENKPTQIKKLKNPTKRPNVDIRPSTRKPVENHVRTTVRTTSVPTTTMTSTTTTTTKKPFVYIPKQLYPPTTKAPKEPEKLTVPSSITESVEADDFDKDSSFLQNFFGLFSNNNEKFEEDVYENDEETEDRYESESILEDQKEPDSTEKMIPNYDARPTITKENIDQDKDRWLGGFKMSHFGQVPSHDTQSGYKDDESIGEDGQAEYSKVPHGMLHYCGSKTDLEFCTVNKLYPKTEVHTVMKKCKVHVDKMVADEIAKLAEHGPLYEYPAETVISDKHKDDERPWPWTQFVYSKDGTCQSSKRLTDPGYAKDMTGAWRIIIQTESHTQRVSTEVCKETSKPCSDMKGEFKKSRCVQKHSYQMLMSVDPKNLQICPEMRLFRFPTACVCQVQVM